MPRSSSFSLINAQSEPACAAKHLIVHSGSELLRRFCVPFEARPFRLGVASWAPVGWRNECVSGLIGHHRSLRLHVI
jgi:hypothetical protein